MKELVTINGAVTEQSATAAVVRETPRFSASPDRNAVSAFLAPPAPAPALPRHVENLLALIQSHFAASPNARPWDRHDDRDYGRILLPLSGEQCRAVFADLRESHTFRPSVADVKKAVGIVSEGTGSDLPPYALAALRDAASIQAEAEAHRTGANRHRRIASTGESDTRQSAREAIRSLPGWRDTGARAHTERFQGSRVAGASVGRSAARVSDVMRSAGLVPSVSASAEGSAA